MLRIPIWLLILLCVFWIAFAEDVTGPAPVGTNVTRPPVVVGGTAFPSPNASPVSQGKADRIATDGAGAVWVKVLGSLTSSISNLITADLDSGAGTQTGAMVGIAVPASGGAVAVGGTGNGLYVQGSVAPGDQGETRNPVIMGARSVTAGSLPGANADNDILQVLVDTYGRIRLAGLEHTDGTVLTGSSGLNVVLQGIAAMAGAGAHDAPVSGNPVLLGAYAASDPGAIVQVGVGDTSRLISTLSGQIRTVEDANPTVLGTVRYCDPAHAGGSSEVTIKGSAGNLYDLHVSNPNTTDVFLLLWDASNPTPGTTAPTASFCVPGGSGSSNRGVYDLVLDHPMSFYTALTATIVTAANGSTAPGSACTINIGYK